MTNYKDYFLPEDGIFLYLLVVHPDSLLDKVQLLFGCRVIALVLASADDMALFPLVEIELKKKRDICYHTHDCMDVLTRVQKKPLKPCRGTTEFFRRKRLVPSSPTDERRHQTGKSQS